MATLLERRRAERPVDAVMRRPGSPYWCPSCDVYGAGWECWLCGSRDVRFGVPVPPIRNGHRWSLCAVAAMLMDGDDEPLAC